MQPVIVAVLACFLVVLQPWPVFAGQENTRKPIDFNAPSAPLAAAAQTGGSDPESMKLTGLILMVAGGVLAVPALMNWSDYSSTSNAATGWDNYFFRRAVGWSIASGSAFGAGMWWYSKGTSLQRSSPSLLNITDGSLRISIPAAALTMQSRQVVSDVYVASQEVYVPLFRLER